MSNIERESIVGDRQTDTIKRSPLKRSELKWFGQPRGLTILFLTEMWTQFSYFGMRALLVYYMTERLGIAQAHSSLIYGEYTAAIYFTPIVGGFLADRYLGKTQAVILGAALMALGHFMMTSASLFYPALATIAVGNGFFLPSLSSQIRGLYQDGDPRISSAYYVYYVGINLGGFLAPLVCGTLGETLGFDWGFGTAGVGMLLALAIYLSGFRYLPPDVMSKERTQPTDAAAVGNVLPRFMLFFGIVAAIIIFRGAYEQAGNTIALYADTGIDRRVVGHWMVLGSWFQALNPLLIFLLAPLFVAYWTWRAKLGREPSSIVKMAIGAAVVAVSYLMLGVIDAWSSAHGVRPGWLWLALFFVVMTAGELFILPVGLGFFGRTAPVGYEASAIATWAFAGFLGNLIAGGLGTFWSQLSPSAYFILVGMIAGVAALLLLIFRRPAARAERDMASTGLRIAAP